MDPEYELVINEVRDKLDDIIVLEFGPQHIIDVLKECINAIKPYANKQEEVTHA